ncbi:MAG: hypothetical protein Q8O43_06505, partial [Dehalococcoidia bacterium]|nr:hypothetical protein [Dehalococcoidia bacterium]
EAEGKNLVAGENRTSLRFFAEFTLSDYEGLQNDTSIFIVRGWRHGAIIDWNEIYGQSELFSY